LANHPFYTCTPAEAGAGRAQFLDALAGSEQYGSHFNFILICCAGPDLATVFADRLQLQHVLNTVAINQPTWGQLGCNGFIILDQKGHVKCNKTMAFMQHREAAFEQLIALMDAMLNSNESDFNAALTGIALTGHETGSSNDAEPEGG